MREIKGSPIRLFDIDDKGVTKKKRFPSEIFYLHPIHFSIHLIYITSQFFLKYKIGVYTEIDWV